MHSSRLSYCFNRKKTEVALPSCSPSRLVRSKRVEREQLAHGFIRCAIMENNQYRKKGVR